MIGISYQQSTKRQEKGLNKSDLQLSMYKIARYIHVVLKNCQKIDQIKSLLFNENFDLSSIFQTLDFKNKGYIDQYDFKKIIVDNGADPKVVKIDRIMRYFGSASKINKHQLLKALALPSWKLNFYSQNSVSNKQKPDNVKKLLFKLILSIYLALQQDDNQRNKLKDVKIEQVFHQISRDKQYIKIDELSFFIRSKNFAEPDTFMLLKFMHNRFQLNLQQFKVILKNSLPQRFQIIDLQNLSNQQNKNKPHDRMIYSTSRKFLQSPKEKIKKAQSIGNQTTDMTSPFLPADFQIINCSQNGTVNANQILNYKISAIFNRRSNIFDKTQDIDLINLLNCQESRQCIQSKRQQIYSRQKGSNQSFSDNDLAQKQVERSQTMKQKNIYRKQALNEMKRESRKINLSKTPKKDQNIFTKKENNPLLKMLKR